MIIAEAPVPRGPALEVAEPARSSARPRAWSRVSAYFELTKPGITRLVVVTAAAGFYLASSGGLDFVLFLHTLVGTALVASGSGALNHYVERDADGLMRRTQRRPLPSHRLTPRHALLFSVCISVAGLVYLVALVGALPAAIVAASLISYVFIYTPLKRRTWLSTIVGAVPGALPILAGWTAAGGALDARGFALFGVLFLWQMPHFYALAWIYREDYVRGGFRMLTAADAGGKRTSRQIIYFTVGLLGVSLLPTALGLTGRLYLAGAAALGFTFLALALAMAGAPTARHAWRLFFGSVIYLPVLLLLMVLDKVVA